jgi:hypothetical protein
VLLLESPTIQVALQEQSGSHTICGVSPLLNADAGRAKHTARFGAGQALVPQFYRATQALAQLLREAGNTPAHRCLLTILAERIPEEDTLDGIIVSELSDVLQVVLPPCALQAGKPLGCQPQRVGHRQAHPLQSEING